jgi:DNA-binding transcriptional LysR family regulator
MLNVFVAVGETQGFAAAAHRLGLSPAAVTRAIAGLETMLGVELLQRTTRNVRLTEAGQRYLDDIRHIVTEIDEVNEATTPAPKGQLVVAAPESFGKFFVMPCITEYLTRFPHVEVVAGFFDRVVDFARGEGGVDVAIGIGRLRDPALISTEVGHVRHVLCASPAYLDRHGTPQHPIDLVHHAVIGVSAAFQPIEWKFGSADGRMIMKLRARLTVTTDEAALAAAARGLGVVRVLSYQAAGLLAEGQLRIVLDQHGESARPVHVLRRERNHDAPKVCQFVQLLVERLGADANLQP